MNAGHGGARCAFAFMYQQENAPDSITVAFSVRQALDSVSKGQQKLDLAQRLTGALSSENDRWAENVVDLRAEMELLTGDVLLAASFIRYQVV